MTSPDDAPQTSIQVIARLFALLDVLSASGQAQPLKALAEQTKLHPSTAHRILNDLAQGGIVERPASGHYRLGIRLLQLGNIVRANLDVKARALNALRELHRQTKQAVSLYLRESQHLIEWPLLPSQRGLPEVFGQALVNPPKLHESDLGLALLTHLTSEQLQLHELCSSSAEAEQGAVSARVHAFLAKEGEPHPKSTRQWEAAPGQHRAAALLRNDLDEPMGWVELKVEGSANSYLDELEQAAEKISLALGRSAGRLRSPADAT